MTDRCNEYREKIAEILAGDVTAVDADAVEQHLLVCPDCLQFHQDILQDDSLLTEFVRSVDDEVTRLEDLVMNSIENVEVLGATTRTHAWWGGGIFQSKIAKFAAAAAVIVVIVIGSNFLDRTGGSDKVWANMMKQVEDAQGYICHVVQTNTADPRGAVEMVHYRSQKFGLRADIYREGTMQAAIYMKPTSNIMYTIVHRDRSYALSEMSDEAREQMLNESNARSLVQYFKSMEFEEIGRRKIDGAMASGIEIINPPEFSAILDETTIRLWVDLETNWPVMIEFEATARGGDVEIERTMDDFRWNPALSADDFEFEIPADYRLLGKMEAPKNDQESAIEGLRAYAALTGGQFPSVLSYTTAMYEVDENFRKRDTGEDSIQEYFDEITRIGSTCAFYGELLENDMDPVYYGEEINTRDYDKVLMRWRLEDGRYRVVYGDLRTEDVSAERLAELEKE